MKHRTFWLWFFAISFGLSETGYFGWNFLPSSDAEIICDGITSILAMVAVLGSGRA